MATKNYGFIRPEYLKPELSTKLYKPTYSYLSRYYSENVFAEICQELQMPVAYLLDEENWVSVLFGAKFAQKVTEKTGDPEAYRKIGHYYFSPENLSPIEYSILKSLSPYLVLKTAEQFYRKRNTACEFKLEKFGLGTFRFSISSKQKLYPEMALNTLGILEAFRDLYNLDLFSVDLKHDTQNELHSFELTMKFAAFKFYLKRFINGAAILGLGLLAGYALHFTENLFDIKLSPLLTALLYVSIFISFKTKQNLNTYRKSNEDFNAKVRDKNQELYEKSSLLERRYQEAALLKRLSAELVGCENSNLVIETCLNSINANFGYKKAAVFLISKERKCLYLAHQFGFDASKVDPSKMEFKYPNPDKKDGFFASILEMGKTGLIHDIESYKSILKPQNQALLEILEVGSMILSPIQSAAQKFGLFVIIRGQHEQVLDKSDQFLIENITNQLSLYFESATNFENEVKFKNIFQKYVPKTVLEQLDSSDNLNGGALEPKRVEIASLFMDLRGFTNACEGVSPERAFLLVNLFAQFVTKALAKHGAIIDNIIGDEIVAFFPKNAKDERANINACLRSIREISNEYQNFKQKLSENGFEDLRLGIGANYGEAIVGSVGGQAKMNFTALGSTVNVASRLQALSKKHQTEEDVTVLVSKTLLKKIDADGYFAGRFESETLRGTKNPTEYVVLKSPDMDLLTSDTIEKLSGEAA